MAHTQNEFVFMELNVDRIVSFAGGSGFATAFYYQGFGAGSYNGGSNQGFDKQELLFIKTNKSRYRFLAKFVRAKPRMDAFDFSRIP